MEEYKNTITDYQAERLTKAQIENFQLRKDIEMLHNEIDDLKCCANCKHSQTVLSTWCFINSPKQAHGTEVKANHKCSSWEKKPIYSLSKNTNTQYNDLSKQIANLQEKVDSQGEKIKKLEASRVKHKKYINILCKTLDPKNVKDVIAYVKINFENEVYLNAVCNTLNLCPEAGRIIYENDLHQQIMELIERHFTDNDDLTEITTDDDVKLTILSHSNGSTWPISTITISRGDTTYTRMLK